MNDNVGVVFGNFKLGDFVEFPGLQMKIFGFICRINEEDNSVDYVRENLTPWSATKNLISRGRLIDRDFFVSKVQENAKNSNEKIPTTEEVNRALKIYESNIDVDILEIKNALNLHNI